MNFFTEIFNAIQNQKSLLVRYQGYKQENPIDVVFHPWYLKQFNNRWFVFGYNGEYKALSNFAIDRILSLEEAKGKYRSNTEIDFEEYFEDVVGVTVRHDAPIEKVRIKIANEVWPYVESKPLHGSQKVKWKNETDVIVELSVQINYELVSLLYSYQDALEILEPQGLRDKFKAISETLHKKYI